VVEGLKQALEIGTSNAVKSVSTGNGYYENPKIKIPLPASVQKVKRLLLLAGYGPQVDAFELSMNRAAEQAAPICCRVYEFRSGSVCDQPGS